MASSWLARGAIQFAEEECRTGHKKRHRGEKSHDTPKYGLLFAAKAGCLPCVRYWHETQGVPLDSTSDNHPDWDVRSYAEHADNENAQDVLHYLDLVSKGLTRTHEASTSEDPAPENDQASLSGVCADPPEERNIEEESSEVVSNPWYTTTTTKHTTITTITRHTTIIPPGPPPGTPPPLPAPLVCASCRLWPDELSKLGLLYAAKAGHLPCMRYWHEISVTSFWPCPHILACSRQIWMF